jgi:hypothetical protein
MLGGERYTHARLGEQLLIIQMHEQARFLSACGRAWRR